MLLVNLQLTAAGESNKIQVDEIPPVYLSHMESNKKQQYGINGQCSMLPTDGCNTLYMQTEAIPQYEDF